MKKIWDIKITKSVLFLAVLAIAVTLVLGVYSFKSIQKVDKNTNHMYTERVEPLGFVAGIRGEFANSRIEAHKAIIKYDSSHNAAILAHRDKINNYLNQYTSLDLSSKELSDINQFKGDLATYLQIWSKINSDLSKGLKMSDDDYNNMSKAAADGENILFNLKTSNINEAKLLINASNGIYRNTIKVFLTLLISSITIFLVISLFIVSVIKKSSKELIENLEILSTGDFTVELETDSKNEFGIMKATIHNMIKDLSLLIGSVKKNSEEIDARASNLFSLSDRMAGSSENVTKSIQEVAEGTSLQSNDLMSTTEILDEFGDQIEKIVSAIENVEKNSEGIGAMAEGSSSNMNDLNSTITQLTDSFKDLNVKVNNLEGNINKINEITVIINSIADQTNLLALNASIEAARAGEQGKGFAVVADEIRILAEQSKHSSETINNLIENILKDKESMIRTTENISEELNKQVKVVDITIESFRGIISALNENSPKIRAINTSAISINSEKNSILQKLEQTSAVSEEISASSQEIVASSEMLTEATEEVASDSKQLDNSAKAMLREVGKFKIKATL